MENALKGIDCLLLLLPNELDNDYLETRRYTHVNLIQFELLTFVFIICRNLACRKVY